MLKNKTQKNIKCLPASGWKNSSIDWIGDVPSGWEIVPLREIFSSKKEIVGSSADKYTLLRLAKGGVFPKLETDGGKNPAVYDAYQKFKKDDLVFCTFDYDVTPRTIGLVEEDGMLTGAYTRLVPRINTVSKYYYYYYFVLDNNKTLLHLCTGLRNTLSKYVFWTLGTPLPPKQTQQKIVGFLDEKTGAVGEVVTKKKKMIELLKEKRSSLITHAVTKGLDPNVEMKNSSVDLPAHSTQAGWIGDIPSGWELLKLKSFIKNHFSGIWGDEEKEDQNDILCLRVADFDYEHLSLSLDNKTIRNIKGSYSYKILKKGDLLLEKSGGGEKTSVGRVVLFDLNEKAVCSNFIEKLTIKNINNKFLLYIFASLHSGRVNTKHIKQTTGIQNLFLSSYFSEQIPLPPKQTQQKIVEFLDKKTAEIDSIISKIEQQITLLDEYKASLIYHAVTGKMSV